jgi:hypothetical protein
MRNLILFIALSGCQRPRVYGEVHIHQFPGGAHPAALFVPRAARLTELSDTLVPDGEAAATVGRCRLYLPQNGPAIDAVDAGAVRVLGGSGIPQVVLQFLGAERGYQADSSFTMHQPVFAGGDILTFEGAEFRGTLRAPRPLELVGPAEPFSSRDLQIRWRPGNGDRVLVTLAASRRDGAYAILKCAAADQAGGLALPASLMGKLPPPPRDLQLEVRRDAIAHAASRDGVVILHVSWAISRHGSD